MPRRSFSVEYTEMTIEKMNAADLKDVLVLAEQLGYPCTRENLEQRFRVISSSDDFALFVAKLGGRVVGYIQINREVQTLLDEPRAEIAAMIVHSDCRSKGIGATLLQAAETWVKEQKLPRIRVRSRTSREGAHRFYQRHGYVLDKTSHIFAKAL